MAHFTEDAKKFKFPEMYNNKKTKQAFIIGFFKEAAISGLTEAQAVEFFNSIIKATE